MDENDAIRALRGCGITDPARLLEHATPDVIVATCNWWQKQSGVRTGLLVQRLRAGGIDTAPAPEFSRQQQNQLRFQEYADRWPEGSTIEPHARLQARRYPEDDPCPGQLVVFEALYPSLIAECDACGFEVGYPLRALNTIPWEKAF